MKKALNECAIIERYEECETARIVAQEFEVSTETIYRILRRNGIQRTHRHQKKPKTKWVSNCRSKFCPALIVMLRIVHNMDSTGIAKVMDCSLSTVSNVITRRGLRRNKTVHKTDLNFEALEAEYLAGATTYELGEKYGVNHVTISKWMCQRGHKRGKGYGQKPIQKICMHCGSEFIAKQNTQIYCSKKCERKEHEKKRGERTHRKRARLYGVEYDPSVKLDKVFERDNGICQICGKPCDYEDKSPNGTVGNNYPSIDHITPMSRGGAHVWENVQLAHMRCNSIKGISMEVIAHAEKQSA